MIAQNPNTHNTHLYKSEQDWMKEDETAKIGRQAIDQIIIVCALIRSDI